MSALSSVLLVNLLFVVLCHAQPTPKKHHQHNLVEVPSVSVDAIEYVVEDLDDVLKRINPPTDKLLIGPQPTASHHRSTRHPRPHHKTTPYPYSTGRPTTAYPYSTGGPTTAYPYSTGRPTSTYPYPTTVTPTTQTTPYPYTTIPPPPPPPPPTPSPSPMKLVKKRVITIEDFETYKEL